MPFLSLWDASVDPKRLIDWTEINARCGNNAIKSLCWWADAELNPCWGKVLRFTVELTCLIWVEESVKEVFMGRNTTSIQVFLFRFFFYRVVLWPLSSEKNTFRYFIPCSQFPNFPDLTWPFLRICFKTDTFLGITEPPLFRPLTVSLSYRPCTFMLFPLQLRPQAHLFTHGHTPCPYISPS